MSQCMVAGNCSFEIRGAIVRVVKELVWYIVSNIYSVSLEEW